MRGFITLASALCIAAVCKAQPGGARKLSEKEQAQWDAALKILTKADKVVLYSLDPMVSVKKEKKVESFRGWKSLGSVAVDGDSRKKVVALVESSKPGYGAKCFDPRHGIRATLGDKSVDFVICFECSWVYVYPEKSDENIRLTVGRDDQPALDDILKAAKVPLPKPAK